MTAVRPYSNGAVQIRVGLESAEIFKEYCYEIFEQFSDLRHTGTPLTGGLLRSQKKEPQSQRIARTAPKNFLNKSRGLPVITHQNKGFEANRTRKFTRKFGEIFVAKVLWGTFSVPDLQWY